MRYLLITIKTEDGTQELPLIKLGVMDTPQANAMATLFTDKLQAAFKASAQKFMIVTATVLRPAGV